MENSGPQAHTITKASPPRGAEHPGSHGGEIHGGVCCDWSSLKALPPAQCGGCASTQAQERSECLPHRLPPQQGFSSTELQGSVVGSVQDYSFLLLQGGDHGTLFSTPAHDSQAPLLLRPKDTQTQAGWHCRLTANLSVLGSWAALLNSTHVPWRTSRLTKKHQNPLNPGGPPKAPDLGVTGQRCPAELTH